MKCPHCGVPIDEHAASRCLDAWVAEAVLGHRSWKVVSGDEELWREGMAEIMDLRFYSTDIAAAWEVVETNREMFANIAWNVTKPGRDDYWSAAFWRADQRSRWIGNADTAPLAICRAALKELGE